MKNIYSLLATLAMLFSMPALASSLMERVAEADCQDPEFRAQFTEEELGLDCLIDKISVEAEAAREGSPICERGGG